MPHRTMWQVLFLVAIIIYEILEKSEINIMRRELGEDATKEYIASKLTQLHSTEQYLNMGGVLRSAGQQ